MFLFSSKWNIEKNTHLMAGFRNEYILLFTGCGSNSVRAWTADEKILLLHHNFNCIKFSEEAKILNIQRF